MHPYAWTWNPEVLVAGMLAATYTLGIRRYAAPRWRIAFFGLGIAMLVAVAVSPVHELAMHYLLSAHLLQNVVLAEWAPALCVLGLPPALAAQLARPRLVHRLTHPLVALPLWLATYFLWHLPAAYDAALRHPSSLLHVEHACYFAAGCLVWWPALQDEPHRLGNAARATYLFAAFILASPLGLLLALIPRAIYDFYEHAPRLWGLSPLADQQIGGATMALEQAAVLFAACTYFFLRFLGSEERAEAFRNLERSS